MTLANGGIVMCVGGFEVDMLFLGSLLNNMK
jgi:hypothetical protein